MTFGRDVAAEEWILSRLRPEDREEIGLVVPRGYSVEGWCKECLEGCGGVWMVWLGEEPVAMVVTGERHPGVWWAGAWSTESWGCVVLGCTRWIRRGLPCVLRGWGARRVEVWSWSGRRDVNRWLESCGGYCEACVRGYGSGGEDFYIYSWLEGE